MPEAGGAGATVRPATPADAEVLARFVAELNLHEGYPVGLCTAEVIRAHGFGDLPEIRALLAELDGRPVGYALFHPSFSTEYGQRGLYLQDLHVTAEARRRGVGRALFAAVARAAAGEGRTFVWWCSKPGNEGAAAFYTALGGNQEEIRAHAVSGPAVDRLVAGDPV